MYDVIDVVIVIEMISGLNSDISTGRSVGRGQTRFKVKADLEVTGRVKVKVVSGVKDE